MANNNLNNQTDALLNNTEDAYKYIAKVIAPALIKRGVINNTQAFTNSLDFIFKEESNTAHKNKDGTVKKSPVYTKNGINIQDVGIGQLNLDFEKGETGFGSTLRALGIDEIGKVNRNNEYENIIAAAKFHAAHLYEFGGDFEKAHAAYNWGYGNVMDAIDEEGANWKIVEKPKITKNRIDKWANKVLDNPSLYIDTSNMPILIPKPKPDYT